MWRNTERYDAPTRNWLRRSGYDYCPEDGIWIRIIKTRSHIARSQLGVIASGERYLETTERQIDDKTGRSSLHRYRQKEKKCTCK